MDFLTKLALSHQRHEGYGTAAARTITMNKNPGALRWHSGQRAFGGVPGGSFTKFPSYEAGFLALKADIRAKICGYSAHIDYRNNPTFLDYIKVYAPAEDSNNPRGYTQALIDSLPEYGLTPDTPLTALARLIEKPYNFSLRSNYRRALRAYRRARGALRRMLARRLARLRK